MTPQLKDLVSTLKPDPWRAATPFTDEVRIAAERIYEAGSDEDAAHILGEWLGKHQPCLFGRIAAKRGQLSYCILREKDLASGDEEVCRKIQRCRSRWTADGFRGLKSGFIVFLISPTVAQAVPGEAMLALAKRLGQLYLLEELETDRVYLDELFLEAPIQPPGTWRWSAGVNYFCSQGDGRWWHDHRIPGGVAFSVNSVGHMSRSGSLAKTMAELREELQLTEPDAPVERQAVDSLLKSLELAMMTIDRAAATHSGKATELLSVRETDSSLVPPCPIELPKSLVDKNHCTYAGYYDTDHTLPTQYFVPDVTKPSTLPKLALDFTYLFDDALDNPDHILMGKGRRIRAASVPLHSRLAKRRKSVEDEIPIAQSRRLVEALRDNPA